MSRRRKSINWLAISLVGTFLFCVASTLISDVIYIEGPGPGEIVGEFSQYNRIGREILERYPAEKVEVGVDGDSTLVVVLTNSRLSDRLPADQGEKAMEIANLAAGVYDGSQDIQIVEVSFVTRTQILFYSYSTETTHRVELESK